MVAQNVQGSLPYIGGRNGEGREGEALVQIAPFCHLAMFTFHFSSSLTSPVLTAMYDHILFVQFWNHSSS